VKHEDGFVPPREGSFFDGLRGKERPPKGYYTLGQITEVVLLIGKALGLDHPEWNHYEAGQRHLSYISSATDLHSKEAAASVYEDDEGDGDADLWKKMGMPCINVTQYYSPHIQLGIIMGMVLERNDLSPYARRRWIHLSHEALINRREPSAKQLAPIPDEQKYAPALDEWAINKPPGYGYRSAEQIAQYIEDGIREARSRSRGARAIPKVTLVRQLALHHAEEHHGEDVRVGFWGVTLYKRKMWFGLRSQMEIIQKVLATLHFTPDQRMIVYLFTLSELYQALGVVKKKKHDLSLVAANDDEEGGGYRAAAE
jgi:hypothetical protein